MYVRPSDENDDQLQCTDRPALLADYSVKLKLE